jgi:hypothetical protein
MHLLHEDWMEDCDIQDKIKHHFSLAEAGSKNLVGLVDSLAEEKNRYESTSHENSGEVELF